MTSEIDGVPTLQQDHAHRHAEPLVPNGRRAVIAFDQVVKRFGSFTAVQETSFAIGEGEFFSILGPSGCGKTTTLRMIAGFERPTSGAVLLDGEDVSAVPPYHRNVNTVFQQYALFPHLDVFDNVAFGLRSKKVPRREVTARVRELLEVVRLPDLAGRKPAQLSGGQQQRVALARALVNRPSALLLDEPLGALDLKLRETMQVELKRIQRDVGSTFVYVTHDQAEALTMSDRIAVMHEGRVSQIGTPPDIYFRPATEFVAGFIGTANLLAARVAGIGGGRVTVDVDGVTRTSLATGVLPAGWAPVTGGAARFMVRPEQLVLTRSEPLDAAGTCAAVVTAITFLGPVLRCTARTATGVELQADLAAGATTTPPRVGDDVWLSWADGAATVVPVAAPAAGSLTDSGSAAGSVPSASGASPDHAAQPPRRPE